MGTKLVVKKICKSDFSNTGDFRKIVKGKNIFKNGGKSKARSNRTKVTSCRSCQSNLWFSVTGNF